MTMFSWVFLANFGLSTKEPHGSHLYWKNGSPFSSPRKKSGNFNQTGKVREKSGYFTLNSGNFDAGKLRKKYWKSQGNLSAKKSKIMKIGLMH